MPVAKAKPKQPKVVKEIPVAIVEKEYKGSIVDTTATLLSEILIYTEGSSWRTDFYSQVLGSEDELSAQQVNQPAIYQQYILTKDLEFKVTSPLSTSQNTENGEMTIQGTGIIYAGIIPNVGDMFLADIGDGREGVFTISSSERKTILKASAYEINYTLVSYNGAERRIDFARKVIRTVYFRKDFIKHGQKPVIVAEELVTIDKINTYIKNLKAIFFSKFFSTEFQTLVVPKQRSATYDPFIVKAILSVFENEDHPVMRKIKQLNIDGDNAMTTYTVWDCLLGLRDDYLLSTAKEMWVVATSYFNRHPRLMGVAYSGFKRVMYPKGLRVDIDEQYVPYNKIIGENIVGGEEVDVDNTVVLSLIQAIDAATEFISGTIIDDPKRIPDAYEEEPATEIQDDPMGDLLLDRLMGVTTVIENDQLIVYPEPDPMPEVVEEVVDLFDNRKSRPSIYSVTYDNCYIFSDNFYSDMKETQSELEVETLKLISGKQVSLPMIMQLCDEASTWEQLEQFYYIPILLIHLKVAMRSI